MVGKFLGRGLPVDFVDQEMCIRWSITIEFIVSALSKGFFLFMFSTKEEKLKVLEQGPWSLAGQLRALEPWHPSFRPTFGALKSIKIWVQLLDFPFEL